MTAGDEPEQYSDNNATAPTTEANMTHPDDATLWSVKGGAGVTVTAGLLAVRLAKTRPQGVILVDLEGDMPSLLGVSCGVAAGVADWIRTPTADTTDLADMVEQVGANLWLLRRGDGPLGPRVRPNETATRRIDEFSAALSEIAAGRSTVIDAGNLHRHDSARTLPGVEPPSVAVRERIVKNSQRSFLVTRNCLLGLRRVVERPVRPDGVILLQEPGRALAAAEVEDVAGVAVVANINVEPAVARAVDAGLLAGTLPLAKAQQLDAAYAAGGISPP